MAGVFRLHQLSWSRGAWLLAAITLACGARSQLLGGTVDASAGVAGANGGSATSGRGGKPSTTHPGTGGGEPSGGVSTEPVVGGAAGESVVGGAGGAPPECPACAPDETWVVVGERAECRVVSIITPRPLAPLSTSEVSSHRPRFRWLLAGQDDGAKVEVCRDRACRDSVTAFSARGTEGRPAEPLDAGLYFWRLQGIEGSLVGVATSPIWQFTVPVRDTATNTSWGTRFDGNGDGYADPLVSARVYEDFHGTAFFYKGGPAPLATEPAHAYLNPASHYGGIVYSAGDINGDGYADLAMGWGEGGNGEVYIYTGGPDGPPGDSHDAAGASRSQGLRWPAGE